MKLRVLALLLALLSAFSALTLAGCSQNGAANGTQADTVEEEQETESKKPTFIEYEGVDWINAVDFGLVGDGETPNDKRMKEYIRYYSQTPMYFPKGVYCFEKSLDFPDNMYLELDPQAELKCIAETPIDFFITVRKDVANWVPLDEYSKSYIKGGTINANYCAKTALAVCSCYHSQFEGFMVKNVLEKGIQTWYNTQNHRDGAFIGRDLVIYNDRAIKGTIGVYDAHYDTNIYETSVVNFETAYYTQGGRFYECTAWVNSGWVPNNNRDYFENLTFAEIAGGAQTIFENCTVDTMRYGYKLHAGASCTVTNTLWFTNTNFYPSETQEKYPRTFFYAEDPATAQFYVNGAQVPADWYLSFSNGVLPNSIFLNVRYSVGATPIPYMRNDTAVLMEYALSETEKPEKTSLTAGDDFDTVTIPYSYDCELRVGTGGKNAPPVEETGVLEVTVVGAKIVQKFIGTKSYAQRIFDGAKWGEWVVVN